MSLSVLFRQQGSNTKQALKKAGLSANAVFFWQRGDYSPNLRNLYKLATANNVTINQILDALGYEPLGYSKLETSVNFKGLIKRSGLKQQELAQVLGTDPPTVSQWSTRSKSPTFEYALKICHIFEVTMDDLAIALFEDCSLFTPKKVTSRELLCA